MIFRLGLYAEKGSASVGVEPAPPRLLPRLPPPSRACCVDDACCLAGGERSKEEVVVGRMKDRPSRGSSLLSLRTSPLHLNLHAPTARLVSPQHIIDPSSPRRAAAPRRCYEHPDASRRAPCPPAHQGRGARQPGDAQRLRGRGAGQVCQCRQGVSCSLRVHAGRHVLTVQCRAGRHPRVQDVGDLAPAPRRAVQVPAAVPAEEVLPADTAPER
jgi:hypothetical protein